MAATHTIKGAGAERQEVAVTHRIKEMGEESEVEEHSEYNSNHYEGASTPRDDKVQGVRSLNIVFFPQNVVILLNAASSAAAALMFDLPLCTLTDTEGKPRETSVRNIPLK